MSNANAHILGAAITVGALHIAHDRAEERTASGLPLASAGLAGCLASLPDWLEPAIHPNHRQVFHSVTFGALLVYAGARLYEWRPEDDLGEVARYVALIGIASYVTHLAMDALTSKSLPLLGRL
jgi:inner membrane protein